MSMRIKTQVEDEKTIQEALINLAGGDPIEASAISKHYILRLALSLSFRQPVPKGVSPAQLRPHGETKSEYRLKQLLDEGDAQSDQVELVRLLLSVAHELDLFNDVNREEYIQHLLEYHLHRGFDLLRRQWSPGRELLPLMADWLSDGELDVQKTPLPEMRLQEALRDQGLKTQVLRTRLGPRLAFYVLQLQQAAEYSKLKTKTDELAFSLGLEPSHVELRTGPEQQTLELVVPLKRENWRSFGMAELERFHDAPPSVQVLPVCPGVTEDGKPFWFDLDKAPHLLVAGTTGSGKSVCVHALVCSLLMGRARELIELTLVDPKRVEFAPYAGLPQLAGDGQILCEPQEIEAELAALRVEMELRYRQFQDAKVKDIAGYRGLGHSLKHRVVVVDELADLLMSNPDVEPLLIGLAQKGRAAGLHLILATQRPDAEILPGLLRSNVPSRIALAVQKGSESKIILDRAGAENLMKPGDMMVSLGGQEVSRVHGINLRMEDIERLVRRLREG